MMPVLIKAIQEQQDIIEKQQAQINRQQTQIDKLFKIKLDK